MKDKKLVFYDGDCGFCNSFILYIIAHDRDDSFRFTPRNNIKYYCKDEFLHNVDSIILKDNGKFMIYSDAIIKILKSNKSTKAWALLIGMFPKVIRNIGYKIVAFFRRRIKRNHNMKCDIPSNEIRRKFIFH